MNEVFQKTIFLFLKYKNKYEKKECGFYNNLIYAIYSSSNQIKKNKTTQNFV
jgi:hypothetical protein